MAELEDLQVLLNQSPQKLNMRFTLVDTERKLKRACDQIVMLNRKVKELHDRYEKVKKDDNKMYRYNIRLKIATVEGVRNMYYEYAQMRAWEVSSLRQKLINDEFEEHQHTDNT